MLLSQTEFTHFWGFVVGLQILQAIFLNTGSNIDLKEKQLTQDGTGRRRNNQLEGIKYLPKTTGNEAFFLPTPLNLQSVS